MKLILPYPPSSNRYWRVPRNLGYPIMSREAREYKKEVSEICLVLGVRDMFLCDLYIVLDMFRPRKSGDLDNLIKIVLDSLNGIVWKDDSQICDIHARKHDDKENPRIELFIGEHNGHRPD